MTFVRSAGDCSHHIVPSGRGAAPGCSDQDRPMLHPTFLEDFLHNVVIWTDSFVPSSWVLGVQVFGRPVENACPPTRCPTQLAFRLGSLHWCMACDGTTLV